MNTVRITINLILQEWVLYTFLAVFILYVTSTTASAVIEYKLLKLRRNKSEADIEEGDE